MDHRAIRSMLAARPFRSFRLRLNDGRTFDVNHPDYLLVGPNGRYLIHHDSANDDAMTMLEPLVIASIEYIPQAPPQPPGTGNTGPGRSPPTQRPSEEKDRELGGEA